MCSSAFGMPWIKVFEIGGSLKLILWPLLSFSYIVFQDPSVVRMVRRCRCARALGSAGGSVLLPQSVVSLFEDEIQQLPAEIRGGTHIVAFDLDVVQVLEAEYVAVLG